MMSAKNAKKRTNEAIEAQNGELELLEELKTIDYVIQLEAGKGFTDAVYPVSLITSYLSHKLVQKLQSLGYSATFEVEDKFSSYIKISWADAKEEI